MHFGLTEEQEMLQETVRGFVAKECPPPRLREIFDAGTGNYPALWGGIVEMGLTGLVIPEEYEGAGMEMLELALVSEILGGGAVPGPFVGHSLACLALVLCGSDEQKKTWLPKLATGQCVGSIALAESCSSWAPASWNAALDGKKLTGTKQYVPTADLADIVIVGTAGGGLALVERNAVGVTLESGGGIDRTRPIFRLELEGTPCETLPCDAAATQRVLDGGLVLLAADSFGAASELVRMSTEYAKTREQFGFPIGQFQAVKHQLARLATDIEPTRALFWYAAYAYDHIQHEASRYAALANAHITDRAMQTARMAVELWGGLGFTWECDVQMWFKRAMFNRAFLGTPENLRERCAALAGW